MIPRALASIMSCSSRKASISSSPSSNYEKFSFFFNFSLDFFFESRITFPLSTSFQILWDLKIVTIRTFQQLNLVPSNIGVLSSPLPNPAISAWIDSNPRVFSLDFSCDSHSERHPIQIKHELSIPWWCLYCSVSVVYFAERKQRRKIMISNKFR